MRLETREPSGMRLLRTQRADIEAIRAQRRRECGIVELGVMRQSDERTARSERLSGKRFVGPIVTERYSGETGLRRESRTRVDDAHAVIRKHRHRRQAR